MIDLRKFLQEHGMTQEQFAVKSGLCEKTIFNYIHGKNVYQKTLDKITKAVNEIQCSECIHEIDNFDMAEMMVFFFMFAIVILAIIFRFL